MTRRLWVWLAFLLTRAVWGKGKNNTEDKPELHILGLFPMTEGAWLGGQSALISAQLAIENINNRSDILPNHNLKLHWEDSQCLAGPGINALFRQLYTPPVKHIIFGPGCSLACQPTAEASHVWNITQVAFACGSPSLSNKKIYKRFFRMVIPDTHYVPLHIKMMQLFDWKKIATIHQSYDVFSALTDLLMTKVAVENVTVLSSESFLSDPTQQVENLKKHDARIIFAGFYSNAARKVFCEAYRNDMYGVKYVWFLARWFKEDWWMDQDTDCTYQEMLKAVDGVLYVGMAFINPLDTRGLAGLTNTELGQAWKEKTYGKSVFGGRFAAASYDGLWAIAVALNQTIHTLRKLGHSKLLEDFDYSDGDIGDIMTQSMHDVDFQGVLGHTMFDENGDPSNTIAIDQQQGTKRVTVGYYQPSASDHDGNIFWVNRGIQWLGGRPPRDASIIRKEHQYVSLELYGTMCVLAAIGMILNIVFLLFNIHFRQKRLIKMSSPNINNVILTGCWLAYCTVFLQEIPGSGVKEEVICSIRMSIFLIGFSLAFGALFSKTWRIHRVLTMSSKMKKVVIKDSMLIGFIMALVTVDVLVLVIWQSLDPLTLKIKDLDIEISPDDPDVETVPQVHLCTCEYEMYFTGTLYVIQGIVLAFGAFLAWETRKVKVEALNDSKQIGMCIYNVLTLSVLGTAVSLLVKDDVDVSYGFMSAITILGTTLIQCLIFVPKILGVKRGEISVTTFQSSSNVTPS